MMKNKINIILALASMLFFTSCLTAGLDELPAFADADISKIDFEYRWFDDSTQKLNVTKLTTAVSIDLPNNTVNCTISVPAASSVFTTSIRNQVSLTNIVGYMTISNAASIRPLGDSPNLGVVTDFSKINMQYEVTAADGQTKKIWILKINSFTNNP